MSRFMKSILIIGVVVLSFIFIVITQLPHRSRHGYPDYVSVYYCVGVVFTSHSCKEISISYGDLVEGNFVQCEADDGVVTLHNANNGETLNLRRRPDLLFYPGANDQSLITDVSNGYIFLAGEGLIVNFRRASQQEVEEFKRLGDNVRINTSNYW